MLSVDKYEKLIAKGISLTVIDASSRLCPLEIKSLVKNVNNGDKVFSEYEEILKSDLKFRNLSEKIIILEKLFTKNNIHYYIQKQKYNGSKNMEDIIFLLSNNYIEDEVIKEFSFKGKKTVWN